MNEANTGDTTDGTSYGSAGRYLEFSLGTENYAIPLLKVREVIAMPKTTPIPNTPPHFVGMMNLRGQVISVVDIRKKMKIQPDESSNETAVIIVDLAPIFLGVVVDSVNKVLSLTQEDIGEKPNVEGAQAHYITGVYRAQDRLTVLMNIGRVLNLEDIKTARKAAA